MNFDIHVIDLFTDFVQKKVGCINFELGQAQDILFKASKMFIDT